MHSLLGRGVTSQQIEQLAQASVGQKVAAGHALMNEGDRPSGLVFLLQGGVEIFKHGPDGQRQSLAKIDAPTLLGEMSLITDRPTSATVIAYQLVMTIAGVLAERLAKLDRKIIELTGHWDL